MGAYRFAGAGIGPVIRAARKRFARWQEFGTPNLFATPKACTTEMWEPCRLCPWGLSSMPRESLSKQVKRQAHVLQNSPLRVQRNELLTSPKTSVFSDVFRC